MQRYAQGLKVPKNMTDIFTGKTSSAAGVIVCNLTYTPKSIHHVMAMRGLSLSDELRDYHKISLVGRDLNLYPMIEKYDKADSPTGSDAGTGAGGGTHIHAITHSASKVSNEVANSEAQGAIVIHYVVA